VVKVREFASAAAIDKRYEQINDFERHLTENGTTVLKFMLNISHEAQGERLRSRLEVPNKRWKFNPGDLDDRKLWPHFMAAYETMVQRTSTAHAPWHVVPSDSRTILDRLSGFRFGFRRSAGPPYKRNKRKLQRNPYPQSGGCRDILAKRNRLSGHVNIGWQYG